MPSATRKNAVPSEPEPQDAPEQPTDTDQQDAPDPLRRELMEYIGDTRIVIPFGELSAGDLVAVPHEMVQNLTDQGLVRPYSGPPVDSEKVRHP